ncbi:MAG: helix-turn-helix transcriptional regulator [Cyclobacteriaceae bacterium]
MRRPRNQDYIKAFGKHLKKLRESKDLTQEELCYRSGLQLSHLGRIERGERTLTIPTLYLLAIALDEEPKKLLDFKFKQKKEP